MVSWISLSDVPSSHTFYDMKLVDSLKNKIAYYQRISGICALYDSVRHLSTSRHCHTIITFMSVE